MGELRTVSPYDVQRLRAELTQARRNGAPPEQVAMLETSLRVGQIELRMRRVLDDTVALDEDGAAYLVSVVVRLCVRARAPEPVVASPEETTEATEETKREQKLAQQRARNAAERRLVQQFPAEYLKLHRAQALRRGIEPIG
jgi:hypothetical protein